MEMRRMIKQLAWETFKNTGDINTFLEYKQIENLENGIKEIEDSLMYVGGEDEDPFEE